MPTSINLPTIADHLRHGQDVILTCGQCDWQRELDLAALVAAGHGDKAVRKMRWRCERCGSRRFAVTVCGHRRSLRLNSGAPFSVTARQTTG
jgi:DNA-directed RNA polymerase subunit RPC12/RpoP